MLDDWTPGVLDKHVKLLILLTVSFAVVGCNLYEKTFGKRQSCGREGESACTLSSPPCDDGLEPDYSQRNGAGSATCVKQGTAKKPRP